MFIRVLARWKSRPAAGWTGREVLEVVVPTRSLSQRAHLAVMVGVEGRLTEPQWEAGRGVGESDAAPELLCLQEAGLPVGLPRQRREPPGRDGGWTVGGCSENMRFCPRLLGFASQQPPVE